ncbi:hypothetical protein [Protaetiibacter mangrovi]|uniref:Uncharacterized protein n=1 Tax=Protaetiibacter mangrovi TaxID=2970926 RepID=A0ABT1ZIT5_9MICO|nr:hypothetical protein [Protaetiibacter mangrovi]MCS0500630.1 hypothetical protein [Protaetiibacter mangrovi]TPX03414.1 hypothetical protein FJ656_17295 [Schumannella luteola]
MKTSDALSDLEGYAGGRSRLSALELPETLELLCRWYADERADDALAITDDGDGLLVEWGTFAFDGTPWQFSVTRQFTIWEDDSDEDVELWQLAITFIFASTSTNETLTDSRWCFDPDDVVAFADSVRTGPAWTAATGDRALASEIDYEQV